MKYLNKYKEPLLMVFIFIVSFIIFNKSIYYYYFQDDWFHLKISNATNFGEFLELFKIRTDIIAWRPVSKQLFFLFNYQFFGLNHIYPHLIIFSIFYANIILLFVLLKKKFKSFKISAITCILYSTSSIHFVSLSWISAGEYVIGTFFWLAASLTYLIYKIKKNSSIYLASIFLYLLCLASTEFALTWPLVIFGYELITLITQKKLINFNTILNIIHRLLPVLMINIIYLFLRFIIFPIPAKDDYSLSINIQILTSYIWYLLWSLNIPEIFKYQVILSKLSFSNEPAFLFHFDNYSTKLFIFYISFAILLVYSLIANIKNNILKPLIITLIFFSITISPVLFIPNHTYPHYLSIPAIAIYLFMAYLISLLDFRKIINKIISISLLIVWLIISLTVVSLTRDTHWIPGEQAISREITNLIIAKHSQVPNNSIFIIQPSTIKTKQSLMDQNALHVIFGNDTISTVFLNDKLEYQQHNSNEYYVNLNNNEK